MSEEKKCALHTLGCKVNQYETEALKKIVLDKGYSLVDFKEKADLYIINTCAVTSLSASKSRQMIRKALKQNPEAKMVVVGCYAQASPQEITEIEGVDLILGTQEKARLGEFLDELASPHWEKKTLVGDIGQAKEFNHLATGDHQERTRAFIKIQEGCEQFCSYCLIPYMRGPIRSRDPKEVLEEVERLVKEGFLEIVLIGIHLGVYGKEDLEGKGNLAGLLKKVIRVEGLARVRLGSLEPTDIDDDLLEILSQEEKICPHFHIPLQSGDDGILKAMNRGYDTHFYGQLVAKIRKKIPKAAISTDLMVGFPGEGEKEFANILNFVEKMAFSRIHVFPYSKRPGTPAANFPNQVAKKVKEERSEKIRQLAENSALEYQKQFIGQTLEVLVEEEKKGILEGLTPHYLRTFFPGEESSIEKIVSVEITGLKEDGLLAQRKGEVNGEGNQ